MNQSFETSPQPIQSGIVESEMSMSFNNDSNIFSGKNFIITILTGLLILSFLGLNILASMGNLVQIISNVFGPLFTQILSVFGYTAGTVIDKSTDIVTDVAKSGIDLAGDTVQSAAELLKDASRSGVDAQAVTQLDSSMDSSGFDQVLNKSTYKNNEPEVDSGVNPIQKPITAGKTSWCLVGEYQGKRGCININDSSKCMSGQVFPTQSTCTNPTRSTFMHSHSE
jgi:hypothetical protein